MRLLVDWKSVSRIQEMKYTYMYDHVLKLLLGRDFSRPVFSNPGLNGSTRSWQGRWEICEPRRRIYSGAPVEIIACLVGLSLMAGASTASSSAWSSVD